MPVFKATCDDCGDVELTARELKLRTCRDSGASAYLFRCPICRMVEVRDAEQHVVDVLLASGVAWDEWSLPGELGEHPTGDAAAPISLDDLIDFHRLLADDDSLSRVIERLAASD